MLYVGVPSLEALDRFSDQVTAIVGVNQRGLGHVSDHLTALVMAT